MRSIPVVVDDHLRADGNLLGHDLVGNILDELTITNRAKEIEQRMNRYGWWKLPDDFLLADLDGDTLVMPRGYAVMLKSLLRQHGLRVQWLDRRQWQQGQPYNRNNGSLKPHQQQAIKQIIRHQQGMYEAPTGSGKTVTCIGFMLAKQPHWTLILVDRLDLLHQWRKELAKWLGVDIDDIGQIGDGKTQVGERVTVATVQTLRNGVKSGALKDEFFGLWDAVILDECHHITAETIRNLVGRFDAKYRFGVSATTDRQDDKFEFALSVLGEVFWYDDERTLRAAGVLMRPRVQVVRTDFRHVYWPDHESEEITDHCLVPGCRLNGKRPHRHRNNYASVKHDLVHDDERNSLIAATLEQEWLTGAHHHLIVSDEVQHLNALKAALNRTAWLSEQDPWVFTMTGQVKGSERVRIKQQLEQAERAIIFATVAKEGLDIPAVDRIYLPFPANNPAKVQQWIGRGTRIAEGKADIVVFDFFDYNVGILRKQFRNRRFKCYDQLDLEVDLGQ